MPDQRATHSSGEFIAEASELVTGLGIIFLAAAPLAAPALALIALLAVLLLIPPLIGIVLAAPVLVMRHWWRAHHAAKPAVRPITTKQARSSRGDDVVDQSRPMRGKS